LITVIISLVALWVNRKTIKDKTFDYRKKISDFANDSYIRFGDEKFKIVAYEYAIAALTKDRNLTSEQRETLLSLKNPVFELEFFNQCQHLIDIKNKSFVWKRKLYKFKTYRRLVKFISISTYVIGGFIFATPFMYNTYFSNETIQRFDHLTPWHKFVCITLILIIGFTIAFPSLLKASSISLAEKILKNQR